jgi:hypothetical protein
MAASCLAPLSLPAFAAASDAFDAFLAVSRVITARASLDAGQAARLYESLVSNAPSVAIELQDLRGWLQDRKIEGKDLQRSLDAQKSPLAALPRKIATAWYTGIVGEGERARCITFETSLMHQAVDDHLRPPSYCFGPYGSWADAPAR